MTTFTGAVGADSGWQALSVASPFAAQTPCAVRKIGNVIYLKGTINRPSGFSTSLTTVLTIPAGYRPTADMYLLAYGTGSNNVIYYGGQIEASTGILSIRQSVANISFYGIQLTYTVD